MTIARTAHAHASAAGGEPRMLKVMCIDDNELVADSLQRRIQHEPALHWLGSVTDGQRIIPRIGELRPDVILMDIDMPGVDTFDLVAELSRVHPAVRVVMFSGHVRRSYLDKALDCGAWGYFSKDEDAATLIAGIRRAGRGQIALGREIEAVQRGD